MKRFFKTKAAADTDSRDRSDRTSQDPSMSRSSNDGGGGAQRERQVQDEDPSSDSITSGTSAIAIADDDTDDAATGNDSVAPSSYKSSLFSSNPTFDSFSTAPSSRQTHGKRQGDFSGTPLQQINEQAEMSSFFFEGSEQDNNSKVGGFLSDDVGRPLRVINADLYSELSTTSNPHSHSRRFSDGLGDEIDPQFERAELDKNLNILNENLAELIDQLNDDSINISKVTVSVLDLLDQFSLPRGNVTLAADDATLKKILKFFLKFHDYYLRFQVYLNSKKLIIRKFIEFLKKLGISFSFDVNGTVPFLRNFPIPLQTPLSPPNQTIAKVEKILNKISNSSSSAISDQQGAFIAPLMRGLSDDTSIVSIMFGIPDPQQEHYDIIDALYHSFPDIHFFVVKDLIQPCNDTAGGQEKLYRFKPPFKLPNFKSPEISISISSQESAKSSGTLGCYLKPIIPSNLKDSSLAQYKDSKFVLTCAHVLLSEMTSKQTQEIHYPKVQTPSRVLINSYKTALIEQRDKYPVESIEYRSFQAEISNCDNQYNLNLGQVLWGERTLIHNKISDIAIVKVDGNSDVKNSFVTNTEQALIKAPENSDLPINLNFQNSNIVKMIPKSQFHNHSNVFKVGSSTAYTTGSINGIKMIYWLEGHLQTSEFVVSASNTFANAGDSGALILNDLKDQLGLGSIGMLHSFDGEMKQLGLFSAMEDIMGRLKDVTGVEWKLI